MDAFSLFLECVGAVSVAASLTRFIVWLDTPRERKCDR